MLNPFPTFQPTRATTRAKTARLVGKEPGRVFVLVLLNNSRGRALRLYDILRRRMVHYAKPSQKLWDTYASEGVEIPYASGVQAEDVEAWCAHAKEQAENLGLTVAE